MGIRTPEDLSAGRVSRVVEIAPEIAAAGSKARHGAQLHGGDEAPAAHSAAAVGLGPRAASGLRSSNSKGADRKAITIINLKSSI